MPSLKDLKNRIESVKSTRKITSAMKMVAASKLKRAQDQAEAARPYAEQMEQLLASLASNLQINADTPMLISGTGKSQTHLLVVITSDRGLCGAFNSSVVRETKRHIRHLQAEGKAVKIFCVGRKGRDILKRDYASLIAETLENIGRKKLSFADADMVTERLLDLYAGGAFDVATVIYNKFRSAITQIVTPQQIIPTPLPKTSAKAVAANDETAKPVYEFEPDESSILAVLLPKNLAIQIYRTLLESAASEQGARMTAMDNATRNAGDMINRLTLNYNRARQAYITKEMIEIVSGAEAMIG